MSIPDDERVFVRAFAFNQDGSCFIAATTAGFRVYTCSPLSEFARRESPDSHWPLGEVRLAAMLYRSCCFALVTADDPRKVHVWDDKKGVTVNTIWCRQPICNVLLGRDIICVVAETTVYVYQAGSVTPLTVIVTGPNPKGLCALSEGSPLWCLTCPTTTPGVIRVQTAASPDASCGLLITAHRSAVGCLAISSCGTLIATASAIGTLIRVFRSLDGTKLYEFRLGTVPRHVRCIAFRGDGRFVAVSSNSTTVHIFKLGDEADDEEEDQGPCDVQCCESTASYAGSCADTTASPSCVCRERLLSMCHCPIRWPGARAYSGQLVTAVGASSREWMQSTLKNVLPTYFDSERSFAQLHLPTPPNNELDIRRPSDLSREPRPGTWKARSFSSGQLSGHYPWTGNANSVLIGSSSLQAGSCNSFPPTYDGSGGPKCAFAGWQSNHFYVLHHDGFLYEARFDAQHRGQCQLLTVSPWFAPRHDFILEAALEAVNPSHVLHEPTDLEIPGAPHLVDRRYPSRKNNLSPRNPAAAAEPAATVDSHDVSTTESPWQLC